MFRYAVPFVASQLTISMTIRSISPTEICRQIFEVYGGEIMMELFINGAKLINERRTNVYDENQRRLLSSVKSLYKKWMRRLVKRAFPNLSNFFVESD